MIGCTSPSTEQKKAEHVREVVDNELGITTPFNCLWNETKVTHQTSTFIQPFLFLSLFSGLFLHRRYYGYCSWLLSSSYRPSSK